MLDRITLPAAVLCLCVSFCANGAEASGEEKESRWRLGAAFGYGLRTNPLVQSDDIPIVVDLDIAWFGERWFFDNGDLGFTALDNSAMTASVVARINSDRVFFGKTNTRFVNVDLAGAPLNSAEDFRPPDRDFAGELGIELLSDGSWGALQFTAFHDVSGTHKGYELFGNYSYGWRNQRLYIEPSVGVSFKSANLNDYYWGVTQGEAGQVAFPYRAGSGVNWHGRLAAGYQLSRHWSVSVAAEIERLNDEAAASPIVADDKLVGWFAGFAFRF